MANDFYTHSGHPGTRAPRSSALLRAEFGSIEDGFDKLPDVSTANLFSVSDGSALVGKTAAQAKVILSLNNCDNTSDLGKPISTQTQDALALKAALAEFAGLAGNNGYRQIPNAEGKYTLVQWGRVSTNASAGATTTHSFPVAFSVEPYVVIPFPISGSSPSTTLLRVYNYTTTGFTSQAGAAGVTVAYIAIGYLAA